MFEKVNPCHPDKVADRIAGALVDIAYTKQQNPKIAVEVLIGHGVCHIIAETSVHIDTEDVEGIVARITCDKTIKVDYAEVPQDEHLAENQSEKIKCGDNGIFKGVATSKEEDTLTKIAKDIYNKYGSDGKYVFDIDSNTIIVCQSNAKADDIRKEFPLLEQAIINPLGDWTGGTNVDTGATNRKLGSDMGRAITGGGLHGKDLSKADVSVNIYCHIKSVALEREVNMCCAIGDEYVMDTDTGEQVSYDEIVDVAKDYIRHIGGFEKLAEWGLIR